MSFYADMPGQGEKLRPYEWKRYDVASGRQRGQQDAAVSDAERFLGQAESGDASAAQQQLRQGQAQSQRQLMAQSQASGASPLGARAALYAAAQQQGDMGMQAAQLRAQEMQAAQQSLLQQRQAMAGAELERAGMAQQLFTSNQGRAEQQRQFNRQMQMQQQQSILGGIMGGLSTGLGAVGMLSDERKKRRIREGDDQAVAMLRALAPATYEYRPEVGAPEGQRYAGVMAQDLERSDMGRAMVMSTPEGRMVDTQQAGMAALGAAAALQRQVAQLKDEGKTKRPGGGR